MIIFGEYRLHDVIDEHVEHDHGERPHRGMGKVLIHSSESLLCVDDPIELNDRLGGLMRSYNVLPREPNTCTLRDRPTALLSVIIAGMLNDCHHQIIAP